jgi:hypothetical protein
MENASREELRQWVAEQMSCLDAPPAPDHYAALSRFQTRLASDRRRPFRGWHAWAAVAAAAAATFLLLPGGRALADQFWQILTMRRVAIIRVKPWPEGAPSPAIKSIGLPIPPIPARDLEEARMRVHYTPRVPYGVFSGSPRISTTFSLAAGTTIKAADLELALEKAGVTDQHVPAAWNGAQLALHTSGIVLAEWPDIVFIQSLPLTFTAPAGFDLSAFSALILRIVGVGPEEAQRLARKAGTDPWWLAPLTPDLASIGSFEEIALNSGPAMLLEEKTGQWRGQKDSVTLLWSVADRVYLLRGSIGRQLAIAAANAVQ